MQGFVQPKILAHEFHGYLIGLRSRCKTCRITRQHVDEQKDEYCHQKQGRQQPEKTFDQIMKHPENLTTALEG